jgi:TolB protein
VNHNLNLNPAWSPDGRSLAYSSHVRGVPDIFIANIYQGTAVENPLHGGKVEENFLPVFSPDGTKIAFQSNRDGNAEIYVMNRDGSGIRRITNHPLSDATPTWSPSGNQIAFVSDRTGSPQIYVVDADGLNFRPLTVGLESYCDRPTWSPPPFNEIAYAARTGGGIDIKVLDLATRERRQITFGEGINESPAYAPNGRHLAFSSTRAGRKQIYVIDRMGKNVRQLTRAGNNQTPAWSR